jgi:hypothetical protein
VLSRRISVLLSVLFLLPLGRALGKEAGHCIAQPNELAVDICVYMRFVTPPAEEPPDTGRGPSLVSKLRGFAKSLKEGNVRDWAAENPARITTVSETPPHAGNTPRYGTVILWSFGGGPKALEERVEEDWPPESYPYNEERYVSQESRRDSDESVRDVERKRIPERSLDLDRERGARDRKARGLGEPRQYALGDRPIMD